MLTVTTFAVTRGMMMTGTICAVALVCGPLLGHPEAKLFGHLVYTGAIYFSVAMFGISLEFLAYGSRAGYNTTAPMVLGMIVTVGSVLFLQDVGLTSPAYGAGTQIPVARLCAIVLLQPLFVHALRRRPSGRQLPRVLGLNFLFLILDALFVVPLTLHETIGWTELVQQVLGSLAMRLSIFAISLPYLAGFIWLQRTGWVPGPGQIGKAA